MLAGSGSGFAALTLSTLPPKLINWVHLIKNDSNNTLAHNAPRQGLREHKNPRLHDNAYTNTRFRAQTYRNPRVQTRLHTCLLEQDGACACLTPARKKGYKHTHAHRRTPAQTRDCWSRTRACSCLACACFRRASIAASCACILAISRPSL